MDKVQARRRATTGLAPNRQSLVQIGLLAVLLLAPFGAHLLGEIYYVNLASRVTLIAMAAVRLNLAVGYGGMVSFGHAAYFGLGAMWPASAPITPST